MSNGFSLKDFRASPPDNLKIRNKCIIDSEELFQTL